MSRARWTDSGRRSDRPPPGFYRTGSNASRRHACARRLLAFAWLLFAGVFGPGVHAADETGYRLGALREMAAAGAPGLALLRLDKAQPDAAQVPEIWARWERSRIDILVDAGARRDAIARLADPPAAAPEPFRRWALARRSDLHLDLGEAEQSRALSRELLWSAGAGATEDELRAWRRLVVRSYLVGGRVGDAVTALRRFDQDYDDDSIGWAVLRTRVLLRSGRAAEAVDRLPEDPEGELHALGLLAHLRAETMEPIAIGERAREAASADATEPVDAARYWYVVAEAAAQRSSHGVRALATEQAAVRAGRLPGSDTVFRMSGDALWSAWLDRALAWGNERQLLVGDDEAWFQAAAESLPDYPVRARSLLAVVALRGTGAAATAAHRRLLDLLADDGPGLVVARQAYLESQRFRSLEQVPEIVRYRLVDDALARDDLDLATRLMEKLPEAPADVSTYAWRLLRARVLVLGGRRDAGVEALHAILDDYPDLAEAGVDRFLQVIFDLQSAQAHEIALSLLQRLGDGDLPGQRRRELLYWRAESEDALGNPRRAAELYLRSATLLDGRGGDPWGQTARYQAAGMLAEAGLVSDARRIYTQLLRTTSDSDRRSTLRRRLQKLGLREPGSDDLPLAAEDP
jgi:tetratricopeptide (TPR) repeat protein